MSVKVMGLVWDHYPGSGEFLTALCLADHADHDGSSIYPSVARIAKKTQQSERTVQRHLAGMKKNGWLVEVEKATGVPGKATTYRIPIERIPLGIDGRVPKLHPSDGCHPRQKGVTNDAKRGDTAMSPKQGLPVKRPVRAQRFAPRLSLAERNRAAVADWVPKDDDHA